MTQSLSKKDRLKSYKRIRLLFATGEKIRVPSLLIYYRVQQPETENDCHLQVGVSVSSRHFKRAVDRNLLKRRMREAYRKQKQPLADCVKLKGISLDLFWVYLEPKILEYHDISSSIEKGINQLLNKLSK